MNVNYVIDKTFDLHQRGSETYIEAQNFSAKIKNDRLKKFLYNITDNNITKLSSVDVDNMSQQYDLSSQAILNFLVEQTGLFKVSVNKASLETLIIVGDGEVESSLASAFGKESSLDVKQEPLGKEIDCDNAIIVNFSAALDSKKIKQLYDSNKNSKNYFVTSYLMGKFLVIDNLYSQHFGLPCHHCHTERLRQNSQLIPDGQKKSWLSYYQEMLRQNDDVLFEQSLPAIYTNYISYCLYQFIRRITDPFCATPHYDEYSQFWHVHLDKMSIFKQAASFWPFCDCQN